jgi:hypothetical protein
MQRRTLFKGLSLLFLPFVRTPRAAAAPPLALAYAGLVYSDSDNTSPTALEVLGDLSTTSGGISYGA